LIANQSGINTNDTVMNACRDSCITIVFAESLTPSISHTRLDEIFAARPEDFGIHGLLYWKFTIERFFYIHELMESHALKMAIQVECDVMLYFNISDYLPMLENHYPSIACLFKNEMMASMSLIYFRDSEAIRQLIEFIIDQMRGQFIPADMYLFAEYKHFAPERVGHLPTLTKESAIYSSIKSLNSDIPFQAWKFWDRIEDWNSIFDNDNLGTYLECGHWGAPQIIFNPAVYAFEWEEDAEHRWIPVAREQITHLKHRYPINTLHVAHKTPMSKYLSIGPKPSFL
jgi:hypothetical protein